MKNIINKLLVVVVAVSCISLSYSAPAKAGWEDGVGESVCTVTNQFDEDKGGFGGLTLAAALWYNKNSLNEFGKPACRDKIIIDTDTVTLSYDLGIWNHTPLVIEPSERVGRVTIYVNDLKERGTGRTFTSEDATKRCALVIRGDYVTLKNIDIQGSNLMGLCIVGSLNKIESVRVKSTQNTAILISKEGKSNIISADSYVNNVKNTEAYGIRIASDDMSSYNFVEPISIPLKTSNYTDVNGLGIFDGDFENASKLAVSLVSKNHAIYSGADVKVVLSSFSGVNGVYDITGHIAKASATEATEICATTAESDLAKSVSKIQVYGVKPNPDTGVDVTFIAYVTSFDGCTGTGCGYGLNSQGSKDGSFTMKLDTNDTRFAGLSQIFFVPEIGGVSGEQVTIGQASQMYVIDSYTPTDTRLECPKGGTCTDANKDGVCDTTTPTSGGGTKAFRSISECQALYISDYKQEVKTIDRAGYDSDHDGISDNDEDTNNNCLCDDDTCWYNPDTDGDGIKDGLENAKIVTDQNSNPSATTINCAKAGMTDCDGDGKPDGVEDRAQSFEKGKGKGYLFSFYRETQSPIFKDNKMIPCTITYPEVGISYDYYYVVDGSYTRYTFETADPSAVPGATILECKNQRLFSSKNFNGQLDPGRGETDAYKFDEFPTTIGAKKCLSDLGNEALIVADPSIVEYDDNGNPTRLKNLTILNGKDSSNNDIKLSLRMITTDDPEFDVTIADVKAACGDMDNDTVPDCMENPEQACYDQISGAKGRYLDPYAADTDGDCESSLETGKCNDYADVNPFSAANGGDLYRIFESNKLLACFVDRDQDGLPDCLEDKNVDGTIYKTTSHTSLASMKNAAAVSESDPLIADTDSDNLNDKAERDAGTNPVDKDSDGDKIADGAELGGHAPYSSSVGSMVGCDASAQVPDISQLVMDSTYVAIYGQTDPMNTDTDGDGIPDGQELYLGTNPNNPDSDGDHLDDGVEKKYFDSREIGYEESNPCKSDTDGDKLKDDVDPCPNDSNLSCKTPNKYGPDTDQDGIPDEIELQIGTDPDNADTDDDGLVDGCESDGKTGELCYHVKSGSWQNPKPRADKGETDPGKKGDTSCQNYGITSVLLADYRDVGANNFCGAQIAAACGSDSDGDGLPDVYETMYRPEAGGFGTDPNNPDTDGDGIVDGIEAGWVDAIETEAGSGIFKLREKNGPTKYVPGSHTDPLLQDTDEDGLWDGFHNISDFEDRNCNGHADKDANGRLIETDPTTPHTAGDKYTDKEKLCWNGICGLQNIGRATTGQREGCASIGGAQSETWGMTLMFAAMLLGTRIAVVRARRKAVKAK